MYDLTTTSIEVQDIIFRGTDGAKLTTEEIELNAKDKYLEIKANGKYKVPFIFEGENLVTLPVIKIDNVTSSFDISNDILNSITIYNSKNIKKIYDRRYA